MESFKYIKSLVMEVLDPKRAEDYENCRDIGWCLFNIASTMSRREKERMLRLWIEFSKKCPSKFS